MKIEYDSYFLKSSFLSKNINKMLFKRTTQLEKRKRKKTRRYPWEASDTEARFIPKINHTKYKHN